MKTLWVLPIAALAVAGCNPKTAALDPKAEALAQRAYVEFVTGQDDKLFSSLPADVNTPMAHRMTDGLRQMVPAGKADAAKLIAWQSNVTTNGSNQVIVYRYDYGPEHLTFTTILGRKSSDQPWTVQGFNAQPATPEQIAAPSLGMDAPIPPLKPAAGPTAPAA